MPTLPPRPCSRPGCASLGSGGLCDAHRRAQRQALDAERGSATERGYGAAWRRLREVVLRRDVFCRAGCGRLATDVDHIRPRRRGGTDDVSNLQGLCHACHSAKTAREDGRWSARVKGA